MLKKLLACGKDMVTENQISVLSPYRAQCHIIEEDLAANGIAEVSVTSIVKSQGMFCWAIKNKKKKKKLKVQCLQFCFMGGPIRLVKWAKFLIYFVKIEKANNQ